jgi:hypothetical protein
VNVRTYVLVVLTSPSVPRARTRVRSYVMHVCMHSSRLVRTMIAPATSFSSCLLTLPLRPTATGIRSFTTSIQSRLRRCQSERRHDGRDGGQKSASRTPTPPNKNLLGIPWRQDHPRRGFLGTTFISCHRRCRHNAPQRQVAENIQLYKSGRQIRRPPSTPTSTSSPGEGRRRKTSCSLVISKYVFSSHYFSLSL